MGDFLREGEKEARIADLGGKLAESHGEDEEEHDRKSESTHFNITVEKMSLEGPV